jgi:hypothetical protein
MLLYAQLQDASTTRYWWSTLLWYLHITIGGILAPGQPLSKEADYYMYFFAGHAIVPLVNSLIQGNLSAFEAYIASSPHSINVKDQASCEIDHVALSNCTCSYGAISPVAASQTENWNVNVRVNMDGNIGATVKCFGQSQTGASAAMMGLVVLVQLNINLQSAEPVIRVTNLKFQLSSYSLFNSLIDFFKAIANLFPTTGLLINLLTTLSTAYRVAGALNSSLLNSEIVNAINNALEWLGDAILKIIPGLSDVKEIPRPWHRPISLEASRKWQKPSPTSENAQLMTN